MSRLAGMLLVALGVAPRSLPAQTPSGDTPLARARNSAFADTSSSRLGVITFPKSGSASAHPHFVRGVLLLHSFEYEDAAAERGLRTSE